METRHLRAPSGDGALLAVPTLDRAPELLARNRTSLAAWRHDFQGRTVDRLRAMARSQVLQAARGFLQRHGLDVPEMPPADAPLVLTGHQPELYHPGVWIKNFAVATLARQAGGAGLNFVVDDDTPKSSTIRVPIEVQGALRSTRVEFDRWGGEVPHEDLPVRDESFFAEFPGRIHEALPPGLDRPLLDEFWPLVLRFREATDRLGLRLALGRRAQEAAWGVRNFEVPLSVICETEAFAWFASSILAHLPRFQEVHNAALDRYRDAYGIRSKNHPVPALGGQGDWLEAPFWAWRASSPRRRPLLVRQVGRDMQIRLAGEDTPLMELPLAPDRDACCAVERLLELPARGVRLRTRALTTTMFARLLLGDLFLHGIGGAKYDELGDEVVRGFFQVEPPEFLTISLTLWLGLGGDSASLADVQRADRALRDLAFNPDRHQADPSEPEVEALIAARRAEIGRAVATAAEKRERYHNLRRYNELLQPGTAEARRRWTEERERLESLWRRGTVARSREYSFVLHSAGHLKRAMSEAIPGLGLD